MLHRLLCDVIRDAGHEADCVKTKGEAEALLAPDSYALVIANVILPDGKGHDVAALADQLGINTVLMSGHPDEIQAMIFSNIVHLAKPFSIPEFEQLLRQRLSQH